MYHQFYFFARKPSLSNDGFHHHYLALHTQSGMRQAELGTKGGEIDTTLGFQRRWVVYNGYAEATRVPPSWHGWLHHTVDVAPTEEAYTAHEWEKPHIPNMTGTPQAYRPSGSTMASGRRPKATGDYQPWTPGN